MTDPRPSRTLDEVPEADLVEQSVPAYPDEGGDDRSDEELSAAADRDTWSADLADVIEQSIVVPLDDEREAELDY